jgi:hypothetical protein
MCIAPALLRLCNCAQAITSLAGVYMMHPMCNIKRIVQIYFMQNTAEHGVLNVHMEWMQDSALRPCTTALKYHLGGKACGQVSDKIILAPFDH